MTPHATPNPVETYYDQDRYKIVFIKHGTPYDWNGTDAGEMHRVLADMQTQSDVMVAWAGKVTEQHYPQVNHYPQAVPASPVDGPAVVPAATAPADALADRIMKAVVPAALDALGVDATDDDRKNAWVWAWSMAMGLIEYHFRDPAETLSPSTGKDFHAATLRQTYAQIFGTDTVRDA